MVVTVYGRMAELLSLADIPVDRVIQHEPRTETLLDGTNAGFRFSFVLPYLNPRLRQTYADLPIIARLLDRANTPVTRSALMQAMTAESVVLDPGESKGVYERLRFALRIP